MKGRSLFTLPADHSPAMVVPKPGASCANCRFLLDVFRGGPECSNRHYRRWSGTSELRDPENGARVMDPKAFCSDWYEPRGR